MHAVGWAVAGARSACADYLSNRIMPFDSGNLKRDLKGRNQPCPNLLGFIRLAGEQAVAHL